MQVGGFGRSGAPSQEKSSPASKGVVVAAIVVVVAATVASTPGATLIGARDCCPTPRVDALPLSAPYHRVRSPSNVIGFATVISSGGGNEGEGRVKSRHHVHPRQLWQGKSVCSISFLSVAVFCTRVLLSALLFHYLLEHGNPGSHRRRTSPLGRRLRRTELFFYQQTQQATMNFRLRLEKCSNVMESDKENIAFVTSEMLLLLGVLYRHRALRSHRVQSAQSRPPFVVVFIAFMPPGCCRQHTCVPPHLWSRLEQRCAPTALLTINLTLAIARWCCCLPSHCHKHTQVPEYLVSRQEEWEREAERRKAEAPDPSCPPGMKLMPEEDRLQTLRQLQVSLAFVCARVSDFVRLQVCEHFLVALVCRGTEEPRKTEDIPSGLRLSRRLRRLMLSSMS